MKPLVGHYIVQNRFKNIYLLRYSSCSGRNNDVLLLVHIGHCIIKNVHNKAKTSYLMREVIEFS
jgi:hypothetical protein